MGQNSKKSSKNGKNLSKFRLIFGKTTLCKSLYLGLYCLFCYIFKKTLAKNQGDVTKTIKKD